jgi:hypothetical protein
MGDNHGSVVFGLADFHLLLHVLSLVLRGIFG